MKKRLNESKTWYWQGYRRAKLHAMRYGIGAARAELPLQYNSNFWNGWAEGLRSIEKEMRTLESKCEGPEDQLAISGFYDA